MEEWIRPVTQDLTESIPVQQQICSDGAEARILDVIDIHLQSPNPHGHQTENHITTGKAWVRIGRFPFETLSEMVDNNSLILEATGDSTADGRNDRVAGEVAANYDASLSLIRVADLNIGVSIEGQEYGNLRKRIRAKFGFARNRYSISCTDPYIWARYRNLNEGDYHLGEGYLTVSLAQRHNDGKCYRIAAAVITLERA